MIDKIINRILNKFINLFYVPKLFLIKSLNKIFHPKKINLGGGSNFNQFGWLNFDINSSLYPTKFDKNTIFPNISNSIDMIYSSHAFEHFDDQTINKLLTEIKRVLVKNGKLLIIIPDYDFLLEKWIKRDSAFFYKDFELGFNKHLHFWKNKNIDDNLDNRAAFMFCSYWNKEFEDKKYRAFQSKNLNPYSKNIFWGPPNFDQKQLLNILKNNSPKEVTNFLRKSVIEKNTDYIFCHQNAWSKKELVKTVESYGFEAVNTNKEKIVNLDFVKNIFGSKEHYDLSNYFLFKN